MTSPAVPHVWPSWAGYRPEAELGWLLPPPAFLPASVSPVREAPRCCAPGLHAAACTAPHTSSCSVLQSQPYRSQPPRHQKLYIFNPATSHTIAQYFFLKQENYPLEKHPGFTKRLLVMQSYLLHICAYIRHMDINIQPNEFQELTLTVKTNQTTAPSTSAQLRGTWKYWWLLGTQRLVFSKPEQKRPKKTLTHCFPNAFGRIFF